MKGLMVEEMPKVVGLYMQCCPGLDGNFRFLPKTGGLYDQDYETMLRFSIIEGRIAEIRKRELVKK